MNRMKHCFKEGIQMDSTSGSLTIREIQITITVRNNMIPLRIFWCDVGDQTLGLGYARQALYNCTKFPDYIKNIEQHQMPMRP